MIKHQVRKKIHVINFQLNAEGMEIEYSYKGSNFNLMADPTHTAELLKRNHYIEDYAGAGAEVSIEFAMSDMRVIQVYWLDFLKMFHLAQCDAIEIVTTIEHDKIEFGDDTDKRPDAWLEELKALKTAVQNSFKGA